MYWSPCFENAITNLQTEVIAHIYMFLTYLIRKERNVLFNDALNKFYLPLYGIKRIVKDFSDSERKFTASTTWATLFD